MFTESIFADRKYTPAEGSGVPTARIRQGTIFSITLWLSAWKIIFQDFNPANLET